MTVRAAVPHTRMQRGVELMSNQGRLPDAGRLT